MVGRFSSSEVGGEKKRASEVTKYLSTYARAEIIAKLSKKNVTASTGIKLVVGSHLEERGEMCMYMHILLCMYMHISH